MALEQSLRAASCSAGREGRKGLWERQALDLAWTFETLEPTHSDILPPTRPHLLILLKQVPLLGDLAFKYMSLWDHSYLNHHIW